MRRFFSVSSLAVTSCAARKMICFSESNPVLTNNQKSRKSPYNVWIEEWELPRLGLVPLVNDAAPTVVVMDKILELVNMSCVTNPPESLLEAPQHSSWQTHKPYGTNMQFQLQNEAQMRNYSSKWWLTRSACRTQGLMVKGQTRDARVITKGKLSLFHASQFADPLAVQRIPVSGSSRKTYSKSGASFAQMVKAEVDNNYSSGLWFTRKQAEAFGLLPLPSAVPLLQGVTMAENFKFYNLDQFQNPDSICEALGRAPVSEPTFLLSGERISVGVPPNNFKSNYYLSGRDADLYNFPLIATEKGKGILLTEKQLQRSEMMIEFFNADQLVDPKRAFEVAGTLPSKS